MAFILFGYSGSGSGFGSSLLKCCTTSKLVPCSTPVHIYFGCFSFTSVATHHKLNSNYEYFNRIGFDVF